MLPSADKHLNMQSPEGMAGEYLGMRAWLAGSPAACPLHELASYLLRGKEITEFPQKPKHVILVRAAQPSG